MGKHGLLRIGWTFIAKRKTAYKIVRASIMGII
nr:MAG TPA: hypothetical protein [Caudoviricetes sp.]